MDFTGRIATKHVNAKTKQNVIKQLDFVHVNQVIKAICVNIIVLIHGVKVVKTKLRVL